MPWTELWAADSTWGRAASISTACEAQISSAVHCQWHFLLHVPRLTAALSAVKRAHCCIYFPMGSPQPPVGEKGAENHCSAFSPLAYVKEFCMFVMCLHTVPRKLGAAPRLARQEDGGVQLWKTPLACLLVAKWQGSGGGVGFLNEVNQAYSSRVRKRCIHWTTWSVSLTKIVPRWIKHTSNQHH